MRPGTPPRIDISPEKRRAVKPPPGIKIDIKGFRFSGVSSVDEKSLQAVVQKFVGAGKTFDDLQAAAEAVSEYLQQQGYFVAQAFLPEQKIADGIVEIAVLEGRLGEVKLDIDQGTPVSRNMIEGLLSRLPPGTVLHRDTIERVLFLLSDLRGMAVRSIVEPGAQPGTANLVVKVSGRKRVDGSIEFDRQGSRYTGDYRLGASLDVNSPFGRGDLLSFRGIISLPGGGRSLDFGRVSYLSPVGNHGTRLGAAYSRLNYHLGTPTFDALDQGGRADVVSVFGLHPIIRTRNLNLFAQAAFDVRDFEDRFQGRNFVIDKKTKLGTLGVVGDSRDAYLGGGINNFSLTYTAGHLDSSATVPGQFVSDVGLPEHYGRLNGSIARLNALAENTVLFVSYAFQFPTKNLDISEKLSLGGPNAVRAYPLGEASADEAHIFTAEVRYGLPRAASIPGNVVVSAFFDLGHAKINDDPPAAQADSNSRTISGAGFGVTWGRQDDFLVRGSLAWRLSGRPTSENVDRKPRLYFQAAKYF
ncbi:MAG: ShlB/FhaC/HecB family hemolysin secretion/activation protein [Burkholderiales bacterium]